MRTSDLDDLRERVSQSYCRHKLELLHPRQDFCARVCQVDFQSLSLVYIRHGAKMAIDAGEPASFFATQYLLTGSCKFQLGSNEVLASIGLGTVISPNFHVKMEVGASTGVLGARISSKALERQVEALTGCSMSKRLEFNPQMNLQRGPMGNHYRLIQFLLDELERENSFLGSPLAVANYEQSVMTSLLLNQPNTYSTQLFTPAFPIASHQVKKVEGFLEGHANYPLDLPTLVRETGYSVNSIYRAFRKYRPYTPMDFLKEVRLKNVRRELLNAPPRLTVTKVATDWGFTHLGRFSAEYKKKFGESPSETSKRAQQKWD